MRSLVFEGKSWDAYKELHDKDKILRSAFCKVLKEMLQGDPSVGIGKPVQLKYELSGLWSRRLSQKDRAIYKYDSETVYIFAIGGHFDRYG